MIQLPSALVEEQKKISKLAKSLDLDFYETIFEMVTYKEMNQIASLGGFPVRYPHWRFGMEYDHLSKSYQYGLSKIYELVINNDPCYAYLLEGNSFIDQRLVMAHVYGHCDFFKNNKWFSRTNRKMMDQMANHATRIRRYIDLYGIEKVERFIDTCLSLENLIDRYSPYVENNAEESFEEKKTSPQESEFSYSKENFDQYVKSFNTKPHTSESLEGVNFKNVKESLSTNPLESEVSQSKKSFYPEKDILKFLIENAPLQAWEADVLSIIRQEAYYFSPQGMTKIINEGWASYWHAKMMVEHICSDSEIIDFSDTHSGTMAMNPQGLNPYKLGIELLRDIESRWDKGQFGKEWSECDDLDAKKNWDRKLNLGREKIFEVRRDCNDVTFIDSFLTKDFCVKNKFFVYKFNKKTKKFDVDTKDFKAIKNKLLFQLSNLGQPLMHIEEKNFKNENGLLIKHMYEEVELQPDYMKETMMRLHSIWKKPVFLATVLDKQPSLVSFDGQEFSIKEL